MTKELFIVWFIKCWHVTAIWVTIAKLGHTRTYYKVAYFMHENGGASTIYPQHCRPFETTDSLLLYLISILALHSHPSLNSELSETFINTS